MDEMGITEALAVDNLSLTRQEPGVSGSGRLGPVFATTGVNVVCAGASA